MGNNSSIAVLVSTGNLGDNIIEKDSFYKGIDCDIDYLAADAGTADAGPTFLGTDKPHNPVEWERHDLELLLLASRKKNIPLVIGSCSTTGTDRAVNLYSDLIKKITKEHKLPPFKLACIYSQIDKEYLFQRLDQEVIEPLGSPDALTKEDVIASTNITASMGVEQFIYAFRKGADVILAGRACDDAVIAAYPVYKGYDKGLSLHMAKTIECASLVCWPQMVKESVIGKLTNSFFEIEPIHPAQKATPHSVAAHSMYERTDPFHQGVPGGVLDMTNSKYEQISERVTRVSGSVFRESVDGSYKVKLEGAGIVGFRSYFIVGVRDSIAISYIDTIINETRAKVKGIMYPLGENTDYVLYFHIYGKNAIIKNYEPIENSNSHEICIVIEAISKDQKVADSVAKCAKQRLFYMSYPGQKNSAGGSVALLTDEPLKPDNACCKWTVDHLLTLKDPHDANVFRYHFETVG